MNNAEAGIVDPHLPTGAEPPAPQEDGCATAPLWPAGSSPLYPDTATWVAEWLCPRMEREITRTVEWCPRWWDHPEAVERLDALWEAWEFGRIGGGPWKSAWWLTHADRHLPRLCHRHRRDTKAWTSEPAPNEAPMPAPTTTLTTKEHADG